MDAVMRFFEMGGYALYVWGAYGMAAVLIGAEIGWLVHRARRSRRVQTQRTAGRRPVRAQWRSAA